MRKGPASFLLRHFSPPENKSDLTFAKSQIIFLGLNSRVGQMVIVLPMGVVYEDSIIQYALSSSNRPKGAIFELASEARLTVQSPLSLVALAQNRRPEPRPKGNQRALVAFSLILHIHSPLVLPPPGGTPHVPSLDEHREKGSLCIPLQGFPAIPSRSPVPSLRIPPLPT